MVQRHNTGYTEEFSTEHVYTHENIRTCMHTHTRIRAQLYTYTNTDKYLHTTNTNVYVCKHYTYTYIHIHTCIYIHTHTCIHIHTHIYTHAHTHPYIHTHTHTHIVYTTKEECTSKLHRAITAQYMIKMLHDVRTNMSRLWRGFGVTASCMLNKFSRCAVAYA